jgi:hypothetical protein
LCRGAIGFFDFSRAAKGFEDNIDRAVMQVETAAVGK